MVDTNINAINKNTNAKIIPIVAKTIIYVNAIVVKTTINIIILVILSFST
jgi:hypothetical protein